MKRGGGVHPARPDWWPPRKRPRATPGGLIAASVTCLSRPEGVPSCFSSFGRNPRGSPDFLTYPVPKACMHVLGTGVPRRLGVARSASSPKAAQALGCSLPPGLRISFGRVTCMAKAASVPGLWALGFLLLCGACVRVWVVLWLGFRLPPATPGWGVGVCVFACALRLYPATPGWGVRCGCVCLGSGFGCAPPLLAWPCGVHVCVRARFSAAPRHSWLGCWGVCVLVCAPRLYPATPGWAVQCGCVCLGSGFSCSPPLPAGVLGCMCVYVCSPLVPRHSWLGCAVCVCVCLGSGLGCASPLLAGVLGCVCLFARSACTPPLLAGVCGVGVCAWARVSAATRHSWLGCAVWVCVLGLGFRLRPATPGLGVGLCLCLYVRSACTPPLLAGVCGVGVCAWARTLAAPRHS